jgi:phosphatidylserine/phosphatidylglycerophosphate/cardiolipin synthase-like enzyme
MENWLKYIYKVGALLTFVIGGVSLGLWQTKAVTKFMGETSSARASAVFSPGPISPTLIKMLQTSRSEIIVIANTLTSKALLDTIEKAVMERDVKAYFILDQAADKGTGKYILSRKLGQVYHDSILNSNQVIVVDKRFVAIGNAKFSTKAEETAQSMVIIDSPELAMQFRNYFKSRAEKAFSLKREGSN